MTTAQLGRRRSFAPFAPCLSRFAPSTSRRRVNLLAASACVLALLTPPLAAQTANPAPAPAVTRGAATGTLSGRVENAVTGAALSNARVSVRGTNRAVFTDEAGRYYLPNVPAGTVALRVTASGLDDQERAVTVTAGQTAEQNFGLTSKALYGEDTTVKLDQFVVQSTRETNAAAIAVNQQRAATNITSVVSADEFGEIVDRNPGEFLKYLPGVDVEYFANNIVGVSVRGLGSGNTEINFDGMPVASMNAEGVSRGMEVQYASAADVARVEVRKLPLPQDSANTVGGTVNFVRRSAFEFSKRKIDYRAFFRSDGEKFTLKDMDGPKDRFVPRWQPNWEVSWTEPVTRSFGFAATIGQNRLDVNTHWGLPGWNLGSSGNNTAAETALAAGLPLPTVPSLYNPAVGNLLNHNAPKMQGKDYASLRLDWRPTHELTLGWSLSGTRGWVQNADDIRYRWNAAATGSGNVSRYNDAAKTLGRIGGGGIYHDNPLWRDVYAPTISTSLEARWRKGDWEASAVAGWSISRYNYYDMEHGFFNSSSVSNVTGLVNVPFQGVGGQTANPIPLTVDFENIDYWGPHTIKAWTTADGKPSSNIADYTVPVDWASNAVTRIGGARARPGKSEEIVAAAKTFVKRTFDFRDPFSLQLGLDLADRFRNRHYDSYAWRFVGADGVPNSPDDSSSLIGAVNLKARPDSEYNYPGSDRVSMSRLYQLYVDHPTWFQYDAARSERLTRTQNAAYDLREKTIAPYLQFDWSLLQNRLHLVGGVRYERVMADARGLLTDNNAAYMKYANGTVVRSGDLDAAGVAMVVNRGSSTAVNYQLVNAASVLPAKSSGSPIFLPSIQAAGNADRAAGYTTDTGTNLGRASLEATRLIYVPKGATGHGMNDGYYPSINASYNLAENLVFQIGYARTQARLDYNNVLIPGTSVSDNLVTSGIGTGAIGTISLHNTDLKPWIADNIDLRLTYYNRTGGYIGLGLFTKRVKNIIADYDTPPLTLADIDALNATFPNLNLGPEAEGYTLSTSINEGNGRLDGAELEMRQSLDPFLPRWARGLRVYASSTYSNPTGPQSNIFSNQAWRDKVNLSFSRRRFSANIGYTMNGEKIENPRITSNGHEGQQVSVRQNLIEFNVTYTLNRWMRLFAGATNITNELRAREQRYAGRPDYASMTSSNTFGKTYTVGLTGSF